MGKLAVGQVVSSAFPFSDLTTKKLRPALVVAIGDFDDVILCQITSKAYSSSKPVRLAISDFAEGKLPLDSYVRPDKLFTADQSMVHKVYGTVSSSKLQQILTEIRQLFTHPTD
ncbi:MAG TPA: type II toxin-antitoxin system PemK/MazF family toxin [Candidatus Limnocylindria bacterium]|nr:type II toxin-antitoxin system PemK/MazF family toxin [Candidatus Limnocylindria bacterium]